MLNNSVTVIDIVAQVTDETASGAQSAETNVSRLERSMTNLQKQIMGMKGKSKLEVAATLKDMASKGIQNVADAGKKIAGKVWTVTLKAVDLVTAPFKKVLGLLANPIAGAAAFAGVSFGVADTVSTFKDFEQGMANVRAITGTVADEDLAGVMQAANDMGISFEAGANATETSMNILTATAKHLGETTMFSAAQASEAMENLAMAGWKAEEIARGMPGLLNLAAAGNVDLATAADVTSSALAQFSLDAIESTRVADVLAATATNSKTDIAGLGESLKMAGTQAGALGYSIEDTALALGLMGNAGIDASSAGTALRSTLARMSKQEGMTAEEANAMAQAMKKVGVSLTDSQGESKSLLTVMKELRAGFAGMTKTEKAATAANLAGMYAQSGLLAIVNASDETFNELAAAIENASGAAAEMAGIKMDTLQGSLYYLQSAAEGVKIAIGEKLSPYVRRLVDWVTAHMPDIQNAAGSAIDFVLGKIDAITASVKGMTNSPEWANAETLWEKIKIAWDKLIAEPFDAWWSGTGKTWLTEKANGIGEGLGTALKTGFLALLGMDAGGAAADGVDIGKSFADGFMEGFDGSKVGEALAKAVKDGLKSLVLDAAALLPGGKEASGTSGLSAAVLGYGAYKTVKTARGIYRGGKALVNGTKAIGSAIGNAAGISEGMKLFKAAQGGGTAARSALDMARSGALGRGMQFGAKLAGGASRAGKFISNVSGPALFGVTSAIQMGADAYHGAGKAKEWTGSDSAGAKAASGIGAMFGGLGSGVFGNESAVRKVSGVAGGALKGAGIGAAAGSILPGVGTAIGGAAGAGIGAAGAAIGGSNIAKALSDAGSTITEKWKSLKEDAAQFRESVSRNFGEARDAITEKWKDLSSWFGDNVWNPIADLGVSGINFAAGAWISISEPIQEKWGELNGWFSGNVWGPMKEMAQDAGEWIGNKWAETKNSASEAWASFSGQLEQSVWNPLKEGAQDAGKWVSDKWTEAKNAIKSAWEDISGWFGENVWGPIKEKANDAWSVVKGKWQDAKNWAAGIAGKGSQETGLTTSRGASSVLAHADGGIMTRPHLGLVAEDGAEAIIPLSGNRRERGLDLWERTGRILGVKPYADGGILGLANTRSGVAGMPNEKKPEPEQDDNTGKYPRPVRDPSSSGGGPYPAGGGMSVPVTIQNLTVEINVDGSASQNPQKLAETIRENIRGMTDDIAYQLAAAMQQVFSNTPKEQWG